MHQIPLRTQNAIFHALRQLNWSYGRGELRYVLFDSLVCTRDVYYAGPRKPPTVDRRKFRFDPVSNTVYFLKHQRKIKL